MLTLAELKHFMPVPVLEENYPTAKYLKTHGTIFVSKSIAKNVKISVYQNGYALYEISGLATVFPIWDCQNYCYEMEQNEISEQWFEKEAWYLRLILEGEDRINRNLETRQQRKSISYSAVSEEMLFLCCLVSRFRLIRSSPSKIKRRYQASFSNHCSEISFSSIS